MHTHETSKAGPGRGLRSQAVTRSGLAGPEGSRAAEREGGSPGSSGPPGGGEARPAASASAQRTAPAPPVPRRAAAPGRPSPSEPPSTGPRAPNTSLPPQRRLARPRPPNLGHVVLHLIQVPIFEGPHEFLVGHRGRRAERRAGGRGDEGPAAPPGSEGGGSAGRSPSRGGRGGAAGRQRLGRLGPGTAGAGQPGRSRLTGEKSGLLARGTSASGFHSAPRGPLPTPPAHPRGEEEGGRGAHAPPAGCLRVRFAHAPDWSIALFPEIVGWRG